MRKQTGILALAAILLLSGCQQQGTNEANPDTGRITIESVQPGTNESLPQAEVLQTVTIDMDRVRESTEGTSVQASLDTEQTDIGPQSLRIRVKQPGRHHITLARLENLDWADLNALVYRARLMTRDLSGTVALGMSVYIQGRMPAEAASSLETSFSRNSYPEWVDAEAVYFTQSDERVGQVELFLTLDGSGTVWVDGIQMLNRSRL